MQNEESRCEHCNNELITTIRVFPDSPAGSSSLIWTKTWSYECSWCLQQTWQSMYEEFGTYFPNP